MNDQEIVRRIRELSELVQAEIEREWKQLKKDKPVHITDRLGRLIRIQADLHSASNNI